MSTMPDEKLMRLAAEAMAGPFSDSRWESIWTEYQRAPSLAISLHGHLRMVTDILAAVTSEIERRALARAADAVEQCAVAMRRQECCGFGRGSPPECCGDPVYMISHEEAAAAIHTLMPKEPNNG